MLHHIRPQAHDRGATAGSLQRPVFIAGAGRSGTTLMRLLSAHSRICVRPETHFMARAEKWGFRERDAPLDIDPDGFRTFDVDVASLDALLQQLADAAPGPVSASAPQPYLDARLP